MELEKTVEDQIMASSLFCFIKTWILVLAPVLMLSTVVVLVFAKPERKPKLVKESADEQGFDESAGHDQKEISSPPQTEDSLASKQQQQQQQHEEEEEEEDCCLVRSPDVLSENECVDYQLSTTEDSEVEWPFRDNMDRSPDYSDDGSISDEDSLIEISLPSGHYVSSHHHKKEEDDEPKFSMKQKLQLPDCFFHQRNTLMELLAELNEMNEEENLIEIDISMGSIKCSRFEIEA